MREKGLIGRIAAFVWRTLVRLFVAALLGCAGAAVYVAIAGVPKPLLVKLQQKIPGRYAFEIGSARLDPFGGLTMNDVRIYRKRLVGPPAVAAGRITAELDPVAAWRGRPFVRRAVFESADFTPAVILANVTNEPPETQEEQPSSVDIEIHDSAVSGVAIDDLAMTARWEQSGWTCENIRARLRRDGREGSLRGRVTWDEDAGRLSGEMTAIMDPHLVFPLMVDLEMDRTVASLERFSFGAAPPRIEARFEIEASGTNTRFRLIGQFWGENFAYAGVDILRAAGTMDFDDSQSRNVLRVEPLAIMRPEGTATGGFTFDYGASTVRFDGTSSIHPRDLAALTGLASAEELSGWVFDGPVRITAHGVVGLENSSLTDFTASVAGRKFGMPPLVAQEAGFDLIVTNRVVAVTNLVGKWCGGAFAGNATLIFPELSSTNPVSYVCDCWIRDAACDEALKTLFGESGRVNGELSMRLRFSGLAGRGRGRTATGSGTVKVRNGRVFTLPVFGGLSDILAKIIPGLDLIMRQSDLTCEFDVAKGVLTTDKLLIEGDVLSLNARGSADLEGNLDFYARVQLMKEHTLVGKILQTLTYPIGKLFEFRVRGTLEKTRWYPVNFSKDLVDRLELHND